MSHPLVIAYHLIWTAYGWWLPNDPRGSGSTTVRSDVLAELGELHYGRKRVQPAGRVVREFYEEAKAQLKHPLLTFDAQAREVIADSFATTITKQNYTCYACVIMPDHVHMIVRKHRDTCEEMMDYFRSWSARGLRAAGLRSSDHPVWSAGDGYSVFLDHPDDIWRTIPYIEKNPVLLGLPVQSYEFVKPYDNWPLHEGHSVNSPYVRALKAAGKYLR